MGERAKLLGDNITFYNGESGIGIQDCVSVEKIPEKFEEWEMPMPGKHCRFWPWRKIPN